MSNKKAQVTIFAIIGAIILFGGGLFFYSQSRAAEGIVPDVYTKGEKIPAEFDAIKKYVDDCAYKASVDGLKLAGEHGGYISMVDPEISTASFKIVPEATESDAVIFSSGSSLAIPYWWHLQSVNNCEGKCMYSSERPELRESENSIEKQLERYVKRNMKICVNNFEAFTEQGYKVEELGDIKVDVVIAARDVSVLVDYPIEADKGSKVKITKYYANVPINLERVYNLATKVTNLEEEHRFLENAVINLIASFASVDKEKLPPVTDMRFSYGSTLRWSKSDVRKKIKGILNSYIGLFQVDGTHNFERNLFGNLLKQRLYDAFIVPVVEEKYNDLAVEFSYLDFWPIYFDLNCDGDICEPESANSPFLNFIGIQRYNFLYDVSYPVLIEIKEPNALNGQGYNFRFFLEGNLRNNEPLPVEFNPLQAAEINQRTYLCDYEQRQSEDITINVLDRVSKKPSGDVKVTYGVAGESCYIGSTDENGILMAKFPSGAVGGVVSLLKEDYLTKSKLFDAGAEKKSLDVELEPIIEKNVVIKKKKLVKDDGRWEFVDGTFELDEEEQAILTLIRSSSLEEQEYSTVAEFTGKQSEPSKLNIAPGKYEAAVTLMLYKDLVVPKKKVHKDGGWFSDDIDYTLPEVSFSKESPFLSGGLNLNITISSKELEEYNTIVFYAIGQDLESVSEQKRDITDLEQMSKYEKYSNVYAALLGPTFENR
ncbi:hypothetical protein ISS05_05660 [Candidatus Woesearchaeota archaeon]|nr:hypothetical protein [Candidatus Woesearchaeota archaeon]